MFTETFDATVYNIFEHTVLHFSFRFDCLLVISYRTNRPYSYLMWPIADKCVSKRFLKATLIISAPPILSCNQKRGAKLLQRTCDNEIPQKTANLSAKISSCEVKQ